MLDFSEEMGYTCRVSEVWLSLVERRVRDAEAASSNLVTSIDIWLVGQAVKTPPSHGGNRGSIPLRAIVYCQQICWQFFCLTETPGKC